VSDQPPTFRATVRVTLKRALLDPQGRAVEATLKRLGATNVGDVRIGKLIELSLTGERSAVEEQLADLVARVLSNPVMEEASYTLTEVGEGVGGGEGAPAEAPTEKAPTEA
jgi:phosphoribosylformylglycinamidine synthase PurS subunit